MGAANWWDNCGEANINGKYGGNGDSGWQYMCWYNFDNTKMALKSMTMMFREVV